MTQRLRQAVGVVCVVRRAEHVLERGRDGSGGCACELATRESAGACGGAAVSLRGMPGGGGREERLHLGEREQREEAE